MAALPPIDSADWEKHQSTLFKEKAAAAYKPFEEEERRRAEEQQASEAFKAKAAALAAPAVAAVETAASSSFLARAQDRRGRAGHRAQAHAADRLRGDDQDRGRH
jgi:hypothetical protein